MGTMPSKAEQVLVGRNPSHSRTKPCRRKRTKFCPEIPPLFRLQTSPSAIFKSKQAQKIRNTVLIIEKSQYLLSKTAKTLLLVPRLLPPECRSVDQALKQSFIGRRKIALGQALSRGPFVRGAADGARLALGQSTKEEFQVNGFPGVVVGDLLKRLAKLSLYAQFLAKFPNKATLKRLARLAFAAGEFPQARQVTAFEALGDEKFLLMKNQSGSDVDGLNGQCSCR